MGGADYRNEGTHRAYCRYVGRLNAVLRDAEPVRPILLYYPIEELQSEFRPYNGTLTDMSKQSALAQETRRSFEILGEGLSRIQASFCAVDRDTLKNLTTRPQNQEEAERLKGKYSLVVFPRGSEKINYEWADPNFREYWTQDDKPLNSWEDVARELDDFSGPRLTPEPRNPYFVEGAFVRDERFIFVVSNAQNVAWNGELKPTGFDANSFESNVWTILDPSSGSIVETTLDGVVIPAELKGLQTLIYVSPKTKRR